MTARNSLPAAHCHLSLPRYHVISLRVWKWVSTTGFVKMSKNLKLLHIHIVLTTLH